MKRKQKQKGTPSAKTVKSNFEQEMKSLDKNIRPYFLTPKQLNSALSSGTKDDVLFIALLAKGCGPCKTIKKMLPSVLSNVNDLDANNFKLVCYIGGLSYQSFINEQVIKTHGAYPALFMLKNGKVTAINHFFLYDKELLIDVIQNDGVIENEEERTKQARNNYLSKSSRGQAKGKDSVNKAIAEHQQAQLKKMTSASYKAAMNGKIIDVRPFIDKTKLVAFIFYPESFTPVCNSELPAYNKQSYPEFSKIYAVSTDTPQTQLKYITTSPENNGVGELNFPVISDTNMLLCSTLSQLQLIAGKPKAARGIVIMSYIGNKWETVYYESIHTFVSRNPIDLPIKLKAIQHFVLTGGQCTYNDLDPGGSELKGSLAEVLVSGKKYLLPKELAGKLLQLKHLLGKGNDLLNEL